MKNLLFITWDGPQTSYMEGLFMPIFHEIAQQADFQFHVIQFTWADETKIRQTQNAAEKLGIKYRALPITRKPNVPVGSLFTVFTSLAKVKKYIKENHIDIVMPRSTFPAMMVNQIKNRNFKLVFDADGLPLEERVDFAGLKKDSRQYRWMKSIETQMLKNADRVITRSQKAIEVHLQDIGEAYRDKFSVVYNGRDAEFFNNNETSRRAVREQLQVKPEELLMVYCGSLGEQYCWEEMITLFEAYRKTAPAKFLILTGNTEFALSRLTPEQQKSVTVKKAPFTEIPFWLSGADVAFALRQPSYSMQGVAPIKLGEYLLMNLPTIASKGIGDTDAILAHFEDCFLYDHEADSSHQQTEILKWMEKAGANLVKVPNLDKVSNNPTPKINTRSEALKWFSLPAAAESYLVALR